MIGWIHTLLLLIIFLIPFSVSAESELPYPNGTVLQHKGYPQKYLVFQEKAWRIADSFTLKELGFTKKSVVQLEKKAVEKTQLELMEKGGVLKLRRPKIKGSFDTHEHFRKDGDMELYLNISGKLGIGKTVFVPTGMGPDNAGYKEHMAALLQKQKEYPDRIIAFCTADDNDPNAPEIFKECLDNGGKGLKLLSGHPEFYNSPIDSDTIKQLFEIASDRDVPVMMHVSIINLPQAKKEFMNLLNQFPEVRVQFAHYCSTVYNGINLNQCEEFLDKYPNLYIDLSMGGGIQRYFKYMTEEGGLQKIKDFILKYQDRIMYGTDMIVAPSGPTKNKKWVTGRMMCDFSLLQEKWYRCPAMNKGEYVLLPGFEFSEEILRKILVENPKRFLKDERT